MDTVGHKLPTEHCRTTTFTTRADFDSCRTVNFTWINSDKRRRVHSLNYLSTETKEDLNRSKPINLQEYTRRWKETLQKLNNFQAEKQTNTLDPDEKTGDQLNVDHSGYSTRMDRPGFPKSWELFSRHREQFLKPRPATATLSRLY